MALHKDKRPLIQFSVDYYYEICLLLFIFSFTILGVGASFFGEILQPQGGVAGAAQGSTNGGTNQAKIVSGDLDASLANLTSNLNLGGGQGFGK